MKKLTIFLLLFSVFLFTNVVYASYDYEPADSAEITAFCNAEYTGDDIGECSDSLYNFFLDGYSETGFDAYIQAWFDAEIDAIVGGETADAYSDGYNAGFDAGVIYASDVLDYHILSVADETSPYFISDTNDEWELFDLRNEILIYLNGEIIFSYGNAVAGFTISRDDVNRMTISGLATEYLGFYIDLFETDNGYEISFDDPFQVQFVYNPLGAEVPTGDYGAGYYAGYDVGFDEGYDEGIGETLDSSFISFNDHFSKWIVPAIIIVMILGGYYSIRHRKMEE